MSRPQLIALGGSFAIVVILFLIVTVLIGGPRPPALGTWRGKDTSTCDNLAAMLTVTRGEIDFKATGAPPKKIMGVSALETEGDAHRIRLFFPDKAPDYDLYAPYQVAGDQLTFGPIDWTPEAKSKYSDFYQADNALIAKGDDSIGAILTTHQPFTRCSK